MWYVFIFGKFFDPPWGKIKMFAFDSDLDLKSRALLVFLFGLHPQFTPNTLQPHYNTVIYSTNSVIIIIIISLYSHNVRRIRVYKHNRMSNEKLFNNILVHIFIQHSDNEIFFVHTIFYYLLFFYYFITWSRLGSHCLYFLCIRPSL